jgi:hypothetical protein
MTILPFRPRAPAALPAQETPARRAALLERVLSHAVAVFVDAVPVNVDVDVTDVDEVRAAAARYAPDASDAVEEALFHHGGAVFGARVVQARAAR